MGCVVSFLGRGTDVLEGNISLAILRAENRANAAAKDRANNCADKALYCEVAVFFADLAAISQQEPAELVKAGCRYIQLDEVAGAHFYDPSIRAQTT